MLGSYFDAPITLRRILASLVVGKYLDAFADSLGAVGGGWLPSCRKAP